MQSCYFGLGAFQLSVSFSEIYRTKQIPKLKVKIKKLLRRTTASKRPTSVCSAPYVSWQRGTARICCPCILAGRRTSLLRVCCRGFGGHYISIDCCTVRWEPCSNRSIYRVAQNKIPPPENMQYLCNQWCVFKNSWSCLILALLWI